MAKETEITTIRIPKSVKDALSDVATEREPYHATISRLISENKQLKQINDNYAEMIEMYKQQERVAFTDKINEYFKKGSDETLAYVVIRKIATDLLPSESERTDALVNNDFLTGLLNDGKEEIVLNASALVKEEILLGDSAFYNQINIVDEFLKYVGLQ